MKKRLKGLAAAGAAVAMLACSTGAMAADAAGGSDYAVQVDGKNLVFTDAFPRAMNGRIFLPVRTVFESLGADLSYEGNVITATRDDQTVVMTIGSTQATVTRGDEKSTLEMDVAPYLDAADRTYAPLRFVAQAFGCAVGWDAEQSTAVIVDVDQLVDSALEGHSFTYLEKYAAYSEQFNQGIWDSAVSGEGQMTITQDGVTVKVPISETATGIVADGTKTDMTYNVSMDMSELDSLVPDGTDMSDILGSSPAWSDMSCRLRGDLEQGMVYISISSPALEDAGSFGGNVWFSLDMNALLESAVEESSAMLGTVSDNEEFSETVKSILQQMDVSNAADGFQTLKGYVDEIAASFSDEAFEREGNNYTLTIPVDEELAGDGTSGSFVFTLTMEKDAVTGYSCDFQFSASDGTETIDLEMSVGMNAANETFGTLTMDIGSEMSMEFALTGTTTQGATAPETEPPAGAIVVSLNDMLQDSIGVIGSPDDPFQLIGGE